MDCRQGDPVEPYLFLLCSEIFAILIKQNKDTKGITKGNTEICVDIEEEKIKW
jgi:hypothetical protein